MSDWGTSRVDVSTLTKKWLAENKLIADALNASRSFLVSSATPEEFFALVETHILKYLPEMNAKAVKSILSDFVGIAQGGRKNGE